MATVAELIVQQLCRAGVRALFGVPGGGSNLDLIAAAGRVGLPFVLTSTETAAAIAATAQAEITGAPGACLTTLGPGATSVVNGVACACLERAPLVVFTDSHAAAASRASAHQRIDHRALLTPVTKSSETLTAGNALQAIARALHAATDGMPGPVHLDCPGDVAAAETATTGAVLLGSVRQPLTPADRARLEDLLARSRKPLLLAGLGSRGQTGVRQGSDDFRHDLRLEDLCDRQHVPALVTYKAKARRRPGRRSFGSGAFSRTRRSNSRSSTKATS
jgi:acetolactate synthase-1/2/3 large subunit